MNTSETLINEQCKPSFSLLSKFLTPLVGLSSSLLVFLLTHKKAPLAWQEGLYHYLLSYCQVLRMREAPIPNRPIPSKASVAGSGTRLKSIPPLV
jgi:hypothetical protein